MNCSEIRERLSARLDGVLDSGEAESVLDHLEACEACREYEAELEATVDLLREVPRPEAPEGFAADVVAALPGGRRPNRILQLAPLAVAAALLIIVAAGFLSRSGGSDRGTWVADSPDVPVEAAGAAAEKDRGAPRTTGWEQSDEFRESEEIADRDESREALAGRRSRVQQPLSEPAPVAEDRGDAGDDAERLDIPADAPAPAPAGPAGLPRPGLAKEHPPAVDQGVVGRAAHGDRGAKAEIRILVSNVDPDTAAGLIIAELNLRRSRTKAKKLGLGGKARDRGADRDEWVESDKSGEPERLRLYLTESEFHFLKRIVERMRGAVLRRVNGQRGAVFGDEEEPSATGGKSGEDAGESAEALRRVSVELRLARAR